MICSMWHQQDIIQDFVQSSMKLWNLLLLLICLARCSLGHARRTELWLFFGRTLRCQSTRSRADVWVAMWKLSNSLQGCGRMQRRSQCLWVPQLHTMTWCIKNVALPIVPNLFLLLSQIASISPDQLSSEEGQRMASGFAASIAAGAFEHHSDCCIGFDTQFSHLWILKQNSVCFLSPKPFAASPCCPCDPTLQLSRVQNVQEINRDTIICNSAISACEKCIEWRLGGLDTVEVPTGYLLMPPLKRCKRDGLNWIYWINSY